MKFLFCRKQTVAEVAKWAIRQSPYVFPENLESASVKLLKLLPTGDYELGYFELSAEAFEKLLLEILLSIPEVLLWTEPKNKTGNKFIFCSAYDKPQADNDCIDIYALVRNVRLELVKEATQ